MHLLGKPIRVTLFVVFAVFAVGGVLVNTIGLLVSMSGEPMVPSNSLLAWFPGTVGVLFFLLAWWVAWVSDSKENK